MNKYSIIALLLYVSFIGANDQSQPKNNNLAATQENRRKELVSELNWNTWGLSLCCPTPRTAAVARELFYEDGPWDQPDAKCTDSCYVNCLRHGINPIGNPCNALLCGLAIAAPTTAIALGNHFIPVAIGTLLSLKSVSLISTVSKSSEKRDLKLSHPNHWQNGILIPMTMDEDESDL